jgi:uncharacterized protein YbcI
MSMEEKILGISEEEFIILNLIYLIEFAPAELLVNFIKGDDLRKQEFLKVLENKGYITRSGEYFTLTDNARKLVEEYRNAIRKKLESVKNDVMVIIRKLEEINNEIKEVITQWQVKKIGNVIVINDHKDPIYDEMVIRKLYNVHAKAEKYLNELSKYASHYRCYIELLNRAINKIKYGGSYEYISTHPASYHNIWYIAHEDWLRLFNLPRIE